MIVVRGAGMMPVVVVHGGAVQVPEERAEITISGVCSAARSGYLVLEEGGSSLDAVVEAVVQMENSPYFSAGCGSVLNVKGEVEMDAIVMDGKTLGSGSVSAVRDIANPVQLARLVMEKTSHAFLTAEGASKFARSVGVPEVSQESLITEYSRMFWKKNLVPDANPVECQMEKMGTVGAVAVDKDGNVACATSTGGMPNKMEGRVGDTPCVGSGGYADNQSGAVSATGHGEANMRVTLSRLILFHMEQGQSAEAASDLGLAYLKSRLGALGGVVTVDPQGNWTSRFSTQQMPWAAAQNDTLHYGLNSGEHFRRSFSEQH
ncbi:isoaspartyl peptidase/L-asparaginase isoform X2 [Oryzias melastigma]|uniref:isoaspartyl peptidase/L-asparaginase isoform X2 n=1 Tax=Oryzias melastigma TaxID=30732 RepID=UPI000CF82EC3|nr:isoaspartyl peptidase/L-asparaginase isoform X2 [Oryzias melastigma]